MIKNAIEIKNLKKIYDNKFEALKSIDLDIPKGSFYGLLGPNGAGKTTTIGAISGLVNYDIGSISIMGHDNKSDYRIARKLIGLSPQELNFDVFFPIRKVLEFQAGYYGLSFNESKERTEIMLEQFGLTEKRNNTCRELSGGMKRRLQIAKALIHNPEILILDEPTAGVDIELRYMLWDFLKKINNEGKTILLTTHYIEEAEQLCDRIAIIDNGNIITNDKTKNLTGKNGNTQIVIDCENIEKDNIIKNFNFKINNNQIIVDTEAPNKTLPNVVEQLNNSNIIINNIEIKKSTLEQVFLKLTSNYASDK
ncbi:MAG: ABC transporter ATP-binding protein [Candidatus Neomarinimicrobiota bacterium]|tara:strand:- start:4334 stop:5260 length:927 start_codon:yes stop_codon:yes gene_type:complete